MESKITAKDFRIGNWVKPGFEDDAPCQITAIKHDCDGYKGYFAEYKGGKFCIEDDEGDYFFEPIPLSESILLKAGFEKIDMSDQDETDDTIWYETEWPVIGVLTTCDKERGNYVFDENTDTLRIKYLHQLQNLFFALCGEELNITF